MKPFYTLFPALIISLFASAQFEAGGFYSLSLPKQEMAENIQPLHSLSCSFLYYMPGSANRVAVGIEAGFGNYASVSKDQDLRFPDSSGITTTVNYRSNVVRVNLQTRVTLFSEAKVNPYVNLKAGLASFFSDVTVEEPDDPDDCRPLNRKNIISDNTFYASYGGGVLVDLSLFSKKQEARRTFLDIAVNRVAGSSLDYINTKNIKDHVHSDPNNPPAPGKSEPLNVRFVNVNTQAVHEHQVAEIYNSPLRMLDFRIGFVFTLD